MSTITSANSAFSLAIDNLYPSPQQIQGYAADDAFASEALDMAEVLMGVDGIMSAGFIFSPYKMTVHLMPTSPSLVMFETWGNATRGGQEVLPANGTVMLPAIGRKYTLVNGILTQFKPFADVKKTLQPTQYVITWQQIVGSAI